MLTPFVPELSQEPSFSLSEVAPTYSLLLKKRIPALRRVCTWPLRKFEAQRKRSFCVHKIRACPWVNIHDHGHHRGRRTTLSIASISSKSAAIIRTCYLLSLKWRQWQETFLTVSSKKERRRMGFEILYDHCKALSYARFATQCCRRQWLLLAGIVFAWLASTGTTAIITIVRVSWIAWEWNLNC